MKTEDKFPVLIFSFFGWRLTLGLIEGEVVDHYISLHRLKEHDNEDTFDAGAGVYLYWLNPDRPMFAFQIFPEPDAYFLWLSPRNDEPSNNCDT